MPGTAALQDLKVVDVATLIAGPGCARHLADFGADVIKVEQPGTGDGARRLGWLDPGSGDSLFWRILARGKRTVTIDLKSEEGKDAFLRLCDDADVVVESFRAGTMERLGLGPDVLLARNPRLVITRVSGFGQDGPYASQPGFATMAEALSGFAAINGEPEGAPMLPPIALTDEVTAIAAAFATMVAVHSGVGQVVDVNLLETMVHLLGPLPSAAAVLGYDQPRMGSGLPYSVPRGTYRSADDRWLALSTSSEPVAARLMRLVGLGDDTRLRSSAGRVAARQEVEKAVSTWVAERTIDTALAELRNADVAAAPVLTVRELLDDPHATQRNLVIDVDGVPMPGPVARLSETPGRVRWAGRPLGADEPHVP